MRERRGSKTQPTAGLGNGLYAVYPMNTTWWAGRMSKDTYSREHPAAPLLSVKIPAPLAAVEEDALPERSSLPARTPPEKPVEQTRGGSGTLSPDDPDSPKT